VVSVPLWLIVRKRGRCGVKRNKRLEKQSQNVVEKKEVRMRDSGVMRLDCTVRPLCFCGNLSESGVAANRLESLAACA